MSDAGKPPSEKQLGLLRAFGLSASTPKEATEKITEILNLPLSEQARLRLRMFEDLHRAKAHAQDSHSVLFAAATLLVHGYAFDEGQAFPLLREYANRSDQPWSDEEVRYKVRSAILTPHDKPQGYLIVENKPNAAAAASGAARRSSAPAATMAAAPTSPAPVFSPRKLALDFDYEKLKSVAAKWRDVVNVEWLANRSAHDPSTISPKRYLELLYRPGEKVLLFTVFKSQGQAFWPTDEVPAFGPDGVWYLAQPVNGQTLPNPRNGRMSRRSQESVTEFRYVVLETDKVDDLPADERATYIRSWLGLIVQLPLRIEAIYTSGGKSVHALVRVDCRTHREWEDYVSALRPTMNLLGMAGLDPATLTSVRLTRLPGCLRGVRLQKLLYLQPGAGVRKICDLPTVRDVTGEWLAKYNRVIDGYEDTSRELRRALDYYAPCNASCRAALRELEDAELTRT